MGRWERTLVNGNGIREKIMDERRDVPARADAHGLKGQSSRYARWRLGSAAVLAFAVSAGLTSIVSGAMNVDAGSYVGDGRDNIAVGSDSGDNMTGNGGEDYVRGLQGGDFLGGGDDDDTLIADETAVASNDSVQGEGGHDEITGGPGNDLLGGGDGDDLIGTIVFSEVGLANIVESGDDTINGGAGNDTVLAGPGNDGVTGGDGADTVDGGCGNDLLDPGPGSDWAPRTST